MPERAAASIWTTGQRGLRLRCPACGAPTLFRAYLKLAPHCASCGADFSRSETADVAPYLTVFLIGLVFTPLALVLTLHFGVTSEAALGLVLAAALVSALVLLPRIKGMLAALLWRNQREM